MLSQPMRFVQHSRTQGDVEKSAWSANARGTRALHANREARLLVKT